jgi:hypothetical protein
MTNFKEIDDHVKYQLDCLAEYLGTESPFRPMQGFRLDFSTILGFLGLMTTYTIVLLQFKIEENKK